MTSYILPRIFSVTLNDTTFKAGNIGVPTSVYPTLDDNILNYIQMGEGSSSLSLNPEFLSQEELVGIVKGDKPKIQDGLVKDFMELITPVLSINYADQKNIHSSSDMASKKKYHQLYSTIKKSFKELQEESMVSGSGSKVESNLLYLGKALDSFFRSLHYNSDVALCQKKVFEAMPSEMLNYLVLSTLDSDDFQTDVTHPMREFYSFARDGHIGFDSTSSAFIGAGLIAHSYAHSNKPSEVVYINGINTDEKGVVKKLDLYIPD